MLATSTKEPVRFTPGRYQEAEGAPVYLVAVPSQRQVISWRRAVEEAGGRYHPFERMIACLRQGIREVVADDQQGELLEILDSYEAAVDARDSEGGDGPDAELEAQFRQIEDAVYREYPPYRGLSADRGRWLDLAPLIACEMFLVGWENLDVPFKRRRHGGGVDPAALEEIGRAHV